MKVQYLIQNSLFSLMLKCGIGVLCSVEAHTRTRRFAASRCTGAPGVAVWGSRTTVR